MCWNETDVLQTYDVRYINLQARCRFSAVSERVKFRRQYFENCSVIEILMRFISYLDMTQVLLFWILAHPMDIYTVPFNN